MLHGDFRGKLEAPVGRPGNPAHSCLFYQQTLIGSHNAHRRKIALVFENTALLIAEAVLYFTVLATLFRLRNRFGLGVFVTALGTMHFLETYLAAILYVSYPGGIVFSPGSTVLFAGKLALLLLVYIHEDAPAVRQPIYGLLIGNFLMVALVVLLRLHPALQPLAARAPDFVLMDQMGAMMVWGTILLFLDTIAIILVYERSTRWLGNRVILRFWLSLAAILTFDQFGFYFALHYYVGAEPDVLFGGWVGKLASSVLYALLAGAYLRWAEPTNIAAPAANLSDVFDALTYRQRYEALLARSGRDSLTGLFDRGRLDDDGPRWLEAATRDGRATSVFVIDVDHFKNVNDHHGHTVGDDVLRLIAESLRQRTREGDSIYRYGGEEFVIIGTGLPHVPALAAAECIRADIAEASAAAGRPITVSIGVATAPLDATNFSELFTVADRRLYAAKSSGRDRVVGRADDQRED